MAWKFAQSPKITELLIAPGNAGTAEVGTNVDIGVDDHEEPVATMARLDLPDAKIRDFQKSPVRDSYFVGLP